MAVYDNIIIVIEVYKEQSGATRYYITIIVMVVRYEMWTRANARVRFTDFVFSDPGRSDANVFTFLSRTVWSID